MVTGGAGFIGANLCRALREDGEPVVVLDDLSSGLASNLDGVDVELVIGDICDESLVAEVLGGASAVVHLAARGSVARSLEDPGATRRANIDGTAVVLDAARAAGVDQVVFASSSSVYGANPVLPKREDLEPRPMSPYAASKLAAEQWALACAPSFGFGVTAFRFFNVYGPLQRAGHPYAAVIPQFVRAVLTGEPVPLYGDGRQSRDFTYVDTVADVIRRALRERIVDRRPINLALGGRADLIDVAGLIRELTGRDVPFEHREERRGDVRHSQADPSRLLELFEGVRGIDLRDGLARTLEWMAPVVAAEAAGTTDATATTDATDRIAGPAAAAEVAPGRDRIVLTEPARPSVTEIVAKLRGRWSTTGGARGALVEELERRVAARLGVRHAIAVSSGPAALALVLRALEVGRPVVVPAYAPATLAASVRWSGAGLAAADVEVGRLTGSVSSFGAVAETVRAGALVPVHVHGTPADVVGFEDLGRALGVPVVFDGTTAFGATAGRPIGSFGDAEVFGLGGPGLVAGGSGGVVTTDRDDVATGVRSLLGADRGWPAPGADVGTGALSDLDAACALASLDRLDAELARRRTLAACYADGFDTLGWLRLQRSGASDLAAWSEIVAVTDPRSGPGRVTVVDALADAGIDSSVPIRRLVHDLDGHRGIVRAAARAEALCPTAIGLPAGPGVGPEEVERIVAVLAALAPEVRRAA
ncbi:MAG: NAD-dependent epimerase/dehydratase family protein [Actinomycetota bacterium]|nr:NAD-dependent epimerase/dehydratase family protein [Actinomycetota bacterium]